MRKYLTLERAFIAVIILNIADFVYDLVKGKDNFHTIGLHIVYISMLICVVSYQRLVDKLREAKNYYEKLTEVQEEQIVNLNQLNMLKDSIIEIHRSKYETLNDAVSKFRNDADAIINKVPSKKRKRDDSI
jgi:hypothetical protein